MFIEERNLNMNAFYFIQFLIGSLVGMLLVSKSGLVEEDAFGVFHYYGFHLSSSFLVYKFKSLGYTVKIIFVQKLHTGPRNWIDNLERPCQ